LGTPSTAAVRNEGGTEVPQFSIFSVDGFEFVDTILRLARPNRSFELAADAHWYSYIHWYNIGYTEHTMVKKLTKHGNSLALVIDRPVLDILKIDAETPTEELRARCRALLRRKREARLLLRAGDLELDRLDHTARSAGQSILLTNKEFALLEYLMLNRGLCVSRVELLDSVWNLEPAQTTNIVDVYVNYLRRKLKDPPPGQLIRTVRGQGYMVPPETDLALAVLPALSVSAILPGVVIPAVAAPVFEAH